MIENIEKHYSQLQLGRAGSNLIKIIVAIIPWVIGWIIGIVIKGLRWIAAAFVAGYEVGRN